MKASHIASLNAGETRKEIHPFVSGHFRVGLLFNPVCQNKRGCGGLLIIVNNNCFGTNKKKKDKSVELRSYVDGMVPAGQASQIKGNSL